MHGTNMRRLGVLAMVTLVGCSKYRTVPIAEAPRFSANNGLPVGPGLFSTTIRCNKCYHAV